MDHDPDPKEEKGGDDDDESSPLATASSFLIRKGFPKWKWCVPKLPYMERVTFRGLVVGCFLVAEMVSRNGVQSADMVCEKHHIAETDWCIGLQVTRLDCLYIPLHASNIACVILLASCVGVYIVC